MTTAQCQGCGRIENIDLLDIKDDLPILECIHCYGPLCEDSLAQSICFDLKTFYREFHNAPSLFF